MKKNKFLLLIIISMLYSESIYTNTEDSLLWYSIKDFQNLNNISEDNKFILIDFYTDW